MTCQLYNRNAGVTCLWIISLALLAPPCLDPAISHASPSPTSGGPYFGPSPVGFAFSAPDSTSKPKDGALAAFEDDLSRSSTKTRDKDDDDEDSFWQAIARDFIWQLVPSLLFGSLSLENEEATFAFAGSGFTSHPYANPDEGLFSLRGSRDFAIDGACAWFRQDGDLSAVVTSIHYAPVPLVGVEAQYARFREELHPGTSGLSITNAFLNYYRVRTPRWALWWGLGAKFVHGLDTHAGFALNLATRIYPVYPVSLHLQTSVGFVGDNSVPEYSIKAAGHWKRIAPFAGYQAWSTGPTTLKGFVGGLEVYF